MKVGLICRSQVAADAEACLHCIYMSGIRCTSNEPSKWLESRYERVAKISGEPMRLSEADLRAGSMLEIPT